MYYLIIHHKDNKADLDELVSRYTSVPFVITTPSHPLEWLLLDDDMEVSPSGLMFTAYANNPTTSEGVKIFILDPIGHDLINPFTRERAKEAITDRLNALSGKEDPIRTLWTGRDISAEEIYWTWLAYGLLAERTVDVVDYYSASLEEKKIPVLHYTQSMVFYGYISGFLDGRQKRQEELRSQIQLVKG